MSIVTMKKQTAATYRASLNGSRGNSTVQEFPGIFSTVGRYRKLGGVQTQHSNVLFVPQQSYAQVHRMRTTFARRPAPYSVFREPRLNHNNQSTFIQERAERERRCIQSEANRAQVSEITESCRCGSAGITNTRLMYDQYLVDKRAICQQTDLVRAINHICR